MKRFLIHASGWVCIIKMLTTVGCTCSKATPSTTTEGAPPQQAHSSARFASCEVLGDDDFMVILCPNDRMLGRYREPKMSDAFFAVSARRYFEKVDPTYGAPSHETITLADGRRGLAEIRQVARRDGGAVHPRLEMMILGVAEPDGSGLFFTCGADPGVCRSDLEVLYARPPKPTRALDGGLIP